MAACDELIYAKKKIQLARLDEFDIYPKIQSLSVFAEQDDLRLLQLNQELAEKVTEGKALIIRGDMNDPAVICSDSCTYELREAETSNSLLLAPTILWPEECEDTDMQVFPQSISGIFHSYYELRSFKPSFKKLRTLLGCNLYKGKEYEDNSNAERFTLENLLDIVQASEEELKVALRDMQTCVIDGCFRILDIDYKFSAFNQILNHIESKSLPLNKIPKNCIIEELQDLEPKEVLEQCFEWFACVSDSVDDYGNTLYALDEDSVCKLFGEVLLRAAGKFYLGDFLESWRKSVPSGMVCNLSQLRGLALTNTSRKPEVIFYFPHYDLPENISERFKKLFKVKEKWSYEEILPYVEERASSVNDVKSLLIKYARESTKDGKKIYSSKW